METSIFLPQKLNFYASSTDIPAGMVGRISQDRSAVVGHNHWCFIYEGSNDYRTAYEDTNLAFLGDKWAKLIESRQKICENLGSDFLQVIVPNKATLLPDFFPEDLGQGITVALKELLECKINAKLVAPVEDWRAHAVKEVLFRRNDSHLTVAGNASLAELILKAFGLPLVDIPQVATIPTRHTGDLGVKFTPEISENYHGPKWNTGLLDQQRIVKKLDITANGFNGIQQSFENPGAPIQKTILVFGNSFFERVPSWGLSPFCTALFKKYYFSWTPQLNAQMIQDVKPDFVITQTCERFLSSLPEH